MSDAATFLKSYQVPGWKLREPKNGKPFLSKSFPVDSFADGSKKMSAIAAILDGHNMQQRAVMQIAHGELVVILNPVENQLIAEAEYEAAKAINSVL